MDRQVHHLASLAAAQPFGGLFAGSCILGKRAKLAFEAPVRFADVNCYEGLSIGAFSFMRSAFISGNPIIGRYCSIGAEFSIGEPDHPMDWLSTSSVQYAKSKFAFFEPMQGFETLERGESSRNSRRARIGNDVWIGSRVTVLRGVRIGDGAVIGAGALVNKDVAPYTVAAGVPAKAIRHRFLDPAIISGMHAMKWWEFLAPSLSGIPFDRPKAALEEIMRQEEAGSIARTPTRYSVIRHSKDGLQLVV